jgi:hypothetical protein
MKSCLLAVLTLALTTHALRAAEADEGFVALADGQTFAGWQMAKENTNAWTIQDGCFVAKGERCHLYYVGAQAPFTNFVFRVELMTKPGSNGGVYFHTKYQEQGWPAAGFETQVNNTQGDWIKTGSLYGLINVSQPLSKDDQWWTQEITVQGNKVIVKVDGKIVLEYYEPQGAQAGKDFSRKVSSGTFAFQAHDPKSVVYYKNPRVKKL